MINVPCIGCFMENVHMNICLGLEGNFLLTLLLWFDLMGELQVCLLMVYGLNWSSVLVRYPSNNIIWMIREENDLYFFGKKKLDRGGDHPSNLHFSKTLKG